MRRPPLLPRLLAPLTLPVVADFTLAAHAAGSSADSHTHCPPAPAVISQLALGGVMLALTATLQLLLTTMLVELIHHPRAEAWYRDRHERRLMTTLFGAGAVALAILIDIVLWALLLRLLGAFPNLESSLYFSGITFTSVGFGDQNLPTCWRLLSVAEAVNGLLIAGWSTALLVALVQRMMELRLRQRR
jgi:hypothetical protein